MTYTWRGNCESRRAVLLMAICFAAVLAVTTAAVAFLSGGGIDPAAKPISRTTARSDQGWPNLFGPSHDSVAPEMELDLDWPAAGPPARWRRTIGTGYSAPVVRRENLVISYRKKDREVIECLDADSGQPRWQFAYATSFKCPYHYSDGPYSTSVLDHNRVYAWGAEGELHCLDLKTGQPLWRRSLNRDFQVPPREFPVGASPLLEGGRLILNVGGQAPHSGIVALDARSGQTLWTATEQGASFATPVAATIHGRRYVFVFTADGLVSLDPESGRVWCSFPYRAKNPDKLNATSPAVHGDLVFLSGYSLGSLCLRVLPDGGLQEIWRDVRALDSQYNNLVCRDGFVYGFSALHRDFRCLELLTGDVRWEWPDEIGRGTSLVVGDRFLLLGEHGHLASLDVDSQQVVLRSRTKEPVVHGPCYAAPALDHGRLYVRTNAELACFDLRPVRHRTSR